MTSTGRLRSFPFARYVFAVLLLLETYISLGSLSGLRAPPQGWWAMLMTAPVLQRGDIIVNVAGYVPMGFFGVLAFATARQPIWIAAIFAVTVCTAQSTVTEILESTMPAVSSNLADVFHNAVGALAGAVAAMIVATWMLSSRWLAGLRDRHLSPGWAGDLGLALLALWALAMLAPRTLLFGVGDGRFAFGVLARDGLQPHVFLGIEAVVCALAVLGFALVLRLTFTPGAWKLRALLLLALIVSLGLRTVGFALFWSPSNALLWTNAGALLGLSIGTLLALALISLAQRPAALIAACSLSLSVLIVNVAPPHPSLWTARPLHSQRIAPLAVASRTTAMLWPAAAIGFALIVAVSARSGRSARRGQR